MQVPSFPSLPGNLLVPPPALPDGTLVAPPPPPPGATPVPLSGAAPIPPSGAAPLYPPGSGPPPLPPGSWSVPPAVSGEMADSSTVPGTGVGCGDLMSSHGFAADAGGLGWLFGVVPPGAEQGTARFAGGAETPVAFHDGLFVVVHAAAQRLETIVFARHGQPFRTCAPSPVGDASGPLC